MNRLLYAVRIHNTPPGLDEHCGGLRQRLFPDVKCGRVGVADVEPRVIIRGQIKGVEPALSEINGTVVA